VKKLNLSHITTRAFHLAQWLYRCSSGQVAYTPSSPTASKSDDEQSKFYIPFYSDRIKQDHRMQSQSLKPKCKKKKVEGGILQELCYIHLGRDLLGQCTQSILLPIKHHLFHNLIFLIHIITLMLCVSKC
jgi:hypothetical protein